MFEIAVAISPVNCATRDSVSAASESGRLCAATMTPHGRPSTMIGHPTAALTPSSRMRVPSGPLAVP